MKKFIVAIVLCCFTFLVVPVHSQDFQLETPKILGIKKGEPAPWDGVLLNMPAAAQLYVNKSEENTNIECQLKIDRELALAQAEYELRLRTQQVHLEAVENKYEEILKIQEEEIELLQLQLKESAGDYSEWWLAGGVVIGIATSILIFYAAVKVQK